MNTQISSETNPEQALIDAVQTADYQRIPVDAVKPHPQNYNEHPTDQVGQLGSSLMQFTQVKNIVIWRGYIIAGEGLWRGAKLINQPYIDVKDVSHWPEARALAFMAVDNELAKGSEPNPHVLAEIIRLAHEGNEATPGVDEAALADLLANLDLTDGTEFGAAPETDGEASARVYKLHVRILDIGQVEVITTGIRDLIKTNGWQAELEA